MQTDIRRSNSTKSLALIISIPARLAQNMRVRLQVSQIESDLGFLALVTFLLSVAQECPSGDQSDSLGVDTKNL